MNRTLADLEITIDDIDEDRMDKFLEEGNYESFDEVLQQIGLGDRVPYAVAKLLLGEEHADQLNESQHSPIVIDSSEGQVVNYGGCCHPIPGDVIMGHLSSGRGLVVHREECPNISDIRDNPEVCMPITWSAEVTGEFQVELWIEVEMFRGVVAQLAARISSDNAGIDNISIEERGATVSVLKLMLRVSDRVHLANLMRRIRLEPYVKKLRRGSNV